MDIDGCVRLSIRLKLVAAGLSPERVETIDQLIDNIDGGETNKFRPSVRISFRASVRR